MQRYRTVRRSAESDIDVKRSRFLGVAARAADESAARAAIAEIRRTHHDARHHCWAYVVGPDAMVRRSGDDGEPSGTAGAPILEAITRRDLSDVVVVVTRWFGGTLLGTGGLARAYGQAATEALDGAGVRTRGLLRIVRIAVEHAEAGRLDNIARQDGAIVRDTFYDTVAHIELGITQERAQDLTDRLGSIFGASATIESAGTEWVDEDR